MFVRCCDDQLHTHTHSLVCKPATAGSLLWWWLPSQDSGPGVISGFFSTTGSFKPLLLYSMQCNVHVFGPILIKYAFVQFEVDFNLSIYDKESIKWKSTNKWCVAKNILSPPVAFFRQQSHASISVLHSCRRKLPNCLGRSKVISFLKICMS